MVPLARGLCFAAFQGFSGRYDRNQRLLEPIREYGDL